MSPAKPTLRSSLEAALLRQLTASWGHFNHAHFSGRLRPPVIELTDAKGVYGRWTGATRTIELQRALCFEQPWNVVLEVLRHEMAHQWVDEALGRRRYEPAHGAEFRKVCQSLGIDAAASGLPSAAAPLDDQQGRALEKIRKLLALAASSNEKEAELAMRRAQEMMLRYNLDEVAASRKAGYHVRILGKPAKRLSRVYSTLGGLLSQHFFVRVIAIRSYDAMSGEDGKVIEITGTLANVEMAEHVWTFMLRTVDTLWERHRADARVRSGRDRLSFQFGVVLGFADKLEEQQSENRERGLVWRGDADLDELWDRRYPDRRGGTMRYALNDALALGREQGEQIVLHRPISEGPSGGRKLLGH